MRRQSEEPLCDTTCRHNASWEITPAPILLRAKAAAPTFASVSVCQWSVTLAVLGSLFLNMQTVRPALRHGMPLDYTAEQRVGNM